MITSMDYNNNIGKLQNKNIGENILEERPGEKDSENVSEGYQCQLNEFSPSYEAFYSKPNTYSYFDTTNRDLPQLNVNQVRQVLSSLESSYDREDVPLLDSGQVNQVLSNFSKDCFDRLDISSLNLPLNCKLPTLEGVVNVDISQVSEKQELPSCNGGTSKLISNNDVKTVHSAVASNLTGSMDQNSEGSGKNHYKNVFKSVQCDQTQQSDQHFQNSKDLATLLPEACSQGLPDKVNQQLITSIPSNVKSQVELRVIQKSCLLSQASNKRGNSSVSCIPVPVDKVKQRIKQSETLNNLDNISPPIAVSFSKAETKTKELSSSKKFICEFCPTQFSEIGNLKVHIRTHTQERPYLCEHCQKTFRTKSILNKHLETHQETQIPKYLCSLCDKRFLSAPGLVKHVKLHAGIKNFKCMECDKAFTTSSHLKRHLLIHSKEKPHKCEVCGDCFNQRGNLKLHEKQHANINSNKCETCHREYRYASLLNRHRVKCQNMMRKEK